MSKNIELLIDRGHGINTLGKASPDGKLKEWAWNDEIAKRIVAKLKEKGYKARLLVTEQYDVSLRERVRRVNNVCATYGAGNVLLISIHVNAAGNGKEWKDARGWSVWIARKASRASKEFAALLYDYAYAQGLKGNRWVPKEKYWQANFAMVANTNCPAVLTENMFQDNKEDCAWLLTEEGKQTIVDIHVNALMEYLNK